MRYFQLLALSSILATPLLADVINLTELASKTVSLTHADGTVLSEAGNWGPLTTSDITLAFTADFAPQTGSGTPQNLWEYGAGTGFSLVYRPGNELSAQTSFNGINSQFLNARLDLDSTLGAGPWNGLEVVVSLDLNAAGVETLNLFVNGHLATASADISGPDDWAGTNDGSYGLASASNGIAPNNTQTTLRAPDNITNFSDLSLYEDTFVNTAVPEPGTLSLLALGLLALQLRFKKAGA